MKILHLFSDWKWTGPSEPILNLCKELGERGHDVRLAYQRPPSLSEDSLEKRIPPSGVKATDRFHLNRSLKLYRLSSIRYHLSDIRELTEYLHRERFDILNVHQSHDHILGGIAAWRANLPLPIIRTDHHRDPLKPSSGNRLLISTLTDGMITFSEGARKDDSRHFGLPLERVCRIPPALDLNRFDPGKGLRPMRRIFGMGPDDFIIGMVARFQKYRRTEILLEAIRVIVQEFPKTKLLLVGRSSQMDESVIRPMKKLGIEPWVILGGYRTDDYVDTLACMDLFVFLTAGSDGTARALREAMAMGKPAVVANRGMLPEIVEDGVSGRVVGDTSEEMAKAILELLHHPEVLAEMGKTAYEKAHHDFRLDRQAEAVEAFYRKMISLGKWKQRKAN